MEWKVPLFDLKLDSVDRQAVYNVLESNWLSMGTSTLQFEDEFRKILGCKYAFAVCNATAALHLACDVIGLKQEDEVIVPSLTFVASVNAITYTGATPVFADITNSLDLTVSPIDIESKITCKTKAILVVHYGGYACDMLKIMEIALKYNLFVIEDCAHVPGASFNGKMLGTIGHIGCFSFFSNKNITCGEGGMVVTDVAFLAERLKLKRSHGMTSLSWDRFKGHAYTYDVIEKGYNYRIDEMSAALGITQLHKLFKINALRKTIVEYYIKKLMDIEEITIPFQIYRGNPSFHIFPIVICDQINRVDFIEFLKTKGIQTSIHYPAAHLFTYFIEKYNTKKGMLVNTEYVENKEITFPLYPTLSFENIDYIAQTVKDFIISIK